MEPGTTTVRIYGQEYTIRSADDPESIHRIADYLDGRMKEVARASNQVSSLRVAILAALNITDELFRERAEGSDGVEEIGNRALELASELEKTIGGATPSAEKNNDESATGSEDSA